MKILNKITNRIVDKICPTIKEFETAEDLDGIIRLYCEAEYVRETVERFKNGGKEGLIILEKFIAVVHPMDKETMEAVRETNSVIDKLRQEINREGQSVE